MAVEHAVREHAAEPLPPHNIEAEEAVLGSLLIDREAVNQVGALLRPEDFYRERNGAIYAAMLALNGRHEPIDYLTLVDELERRNKYDEVGGLSYLSSLLTIVPTSAHVEHYARIVARTALMRRLIQAAGQIARLAYQDSPDEPKVLGEAQRLLMAVAQRRVSGDFQSLADILARYLDQIEEVREGEAEGRIKYGIPTGFIDLDKLLGGLQRSDLVILAARPSLGKTSLALNIAASAAVKLRATVAIFSLEMSTIQLAARLLSMESGVDSTRLRTGRFSQAESRKIGHAMGTLSEAPIFVDDSPAITITELSFKARRFHAEHGSDMIIVDYLQLLTGQGRDNRVQEISDISRNLKSLARELNVPVLAVSQLSRAVEGRTPHVPVLSDLRESGSIEQDADVVLFIYREEVYDRETLKKGVADIHVAKHRNGPTGQVSLLFMERTTKFVDYEPHAFVEP